jgi:hypothetical protein
VTTTPRSLIAYAPYGVGLMCALVYFERDADVYGWWIGARDSEYLSAYFRLEHLFSSKPTRFYASEGSDLYDGWKHLYSARETKLDKPVPVEDAISHELERVQGMFVSEWLFFDNDPDIAAERAAYDRYNMPLGTVNLRAHRLNRLDKHHAVWLYRSHDFQAAVLEYLQRFWPIDYRST